MSLETKDRRARIGFGGAHVLVALFVAWGVFRLLPTRWWPVDVGAAIVSASLGVAGVALLRNAQLAARLTRIASIIVLVLGLLVVGALVLTASWISGVYAQVGVTGAIVFGLVAALIVPYLVVFPVATLVWIGPARSVPREKKGRG